MDPGGKCGRGSRDPPYLCHQPSLWVLCAVRHAMFTAALLLPLSLAVAQQPQDPALPAQLHALRAGLAGLQDRLLALEQQVQIHRCSTA